VNRNKRIKNFLLLGIQLCLSHVGILWAQPKAPINVVATPLRETQIQLNWRTESLNVANVLIERQQNFGNWEILTVRPTLNEISYLDTGLSNGAYYCYRMYAEGTGGRSIASDMACALTGKQIEGTPILAQIALADPVTIAVGWAVNQAENYRFRVQRRTPTGGWQTIAEELEKTVWSNTDLDELSTFCYRVQGYKTGFASEYSAEACQTTYVLTPLPVKDLILSNDATNPDHALRASWKQGDLFRNVVFEVQSRRAGESWGGTQTVVTPTFELNNLPNLTQYELRVRARRTISNITLFSEWVTSGSVNTWLAIWPGDTDGDGQVGPADITRLTNSSVYGKRSSFSGTPISTTLNWEKLSINPGNADVNVLRADANRDGLVDVYDLFPIVANYGRRVSGSPYMNTIARITEKQQADLIRQMEAQLRQDPIAGVIADDLKTLLRTWEEVQNDQTATTPKQTGLLPNFPNPFSGYTNLSWQLAEASAVKILVVDILGREQVLVNSESMSEGVHHITWQPQNLAAGTYFLVFEVNGLRTTRTIQKVR